MTNERIEPYNTFITNDGSLNERISRATNLADEEALL